MSWEGLNRRKFPRANFPCLIKVLQLGTAVDPVLAHTENISLGGIGVIVKHAFELFEPIGLELDLLDGGQNIRCRGKVVWSIRRKATDEKKPSFYDIGIEFVDIADADKKRIEIILSHLIKHLQKEKI